MSGGGNGVGRFYRSRLFWLGLPGLVFLLWVWWDSGGYWSRVEWGRNRVKQSAGVSNGTIDWERSTWRLDSQLAEGLSCIRQEIRSEGSVKERGFDVRLAFSARTDFWPQSYYPSKIESVSVALWVVVLGYSMMWLGAVCGWQCWKRKRMVKDLTEVEVAS